MNLMKFRFVLGVTALAVVSTLAVLVLFFGRGLEKDQTSVLLVIVMALVAETKASSAYAFDGTPKTPDAKSASTETPSTTA